MGSVNDIDKINSILNVNAQKNFVQRILTPDQFPTLDLGDGNYATHKMAWATVDGKPIVYPTIIYQAGMNQLVPLDENSALNYALQSGEYIPFDNTADADWFSKNYKKVWKK